MTAIRCQQCGNKADVVLSRLRSLLWFRSLGEFCQHCEKTSIEPSRWTENDVSQDREKAGLTT